MSHPLPSDCAKLCPDYETCTRTHCNRKKGFIGKGDIYMMNDEDSSKWTYVMKRARYRESRETQINGGKFRRARLV